MPKVKPQILKGFHDYLPAQMIPRQRMLAAIERTFQRFGFAPLMTPALEYFEVLSGKYGEEGETLLYRFQDQGERDVALRYDLTVPLARTVAQYPEEITLPFRRYQIAPVWRAEKPGQGRFREFVQCDGDIVGSKDMTADAEIVALARELLAGLGVERFQVRLNNRKVLSGLMAEIGVAAGAAEAAVLRTIDKLPKIGNEKTEQLLREECNLDPAQVAKVFNFLATAGKPLEVVERLRARFPADTAGGQGAAELGELFGILEGAGLGASVALDLSIARGLNYYTGTIYEVFLDAPDLGAVMGGGRYDGLIGIFKGQDIPAVGISLGIDRLFTGLVKLGLLREEQRVAEVLVTVFGAETAAYSARAAALLRAGGIACELFPSYAKLKNQLRHAERLGYRWVVIAGPDEAGRGQVTVKEMQARAGESAGSSGGEEARNLGEAVALEQLVPYLAARA
jgi:histidyl-tRNA synthetase